MRATVKLFVLSLCLLGAAALGHSPETPGKAFYEGPIDGSFSWPLDDPANWYGQYYACFNCINTSKYHTGIDISPYGYTFDQDYADESKYQVNALAAARGTVVKVVQIPQPGSPAHDNWCATRKPDLERRAGGSGCVDHGLGNTVILRHDHLGIYTLYGHLDSIAPGLIAGREVAAGTPLGKMGHSGDGLRRNYCNRQDGNNSNDFCPHVHFEAKLIGALGNLGDQGPLWGYSPAPSPSNYGYVNPNAYLDHVLSGQRTPVRALGDQKAVSYPGGSLKVADVKGGSWLISFGEADGWFQVFLPDGQGPATGWIRAVPDSSVRALKVHDSEPTAGIRVRQTAGTGGNETGFRVWVGQWVATDGAQAQGAGCSKSWLKVFLPSNGSGWVCGEFLQSEATAAPTSPAGLQAAALSSSSIRLTWTDRSQDETEFRLLRKDGADGAWKPAGRADRDKTELIDSGLSQGVTYFYKVRACNSVSCSPFSNEASARTGNPTRPKPPSNLSARAGTATQINLSWKDESSDEQSFEIQRFKARGTWTTVAQAPAGSVSFPDGGLEPGATYTYRVRACNAAGCSNFSNEASATTPRASVPSVPATLSAVARAWDRIELAWQDSEGEARYQIERRAGSEVAWSPLREAAANQTVLTDTGLRERTAYAYRMRACNQEGCSGYSNTATATTPAQPVAVAADLVAQDLVLSAGSGAPGSRLTVSFTVRNQGNGTAQASQAVLRLSPSSTAPADSDPQMAQVNVPSLPPGGTHAASPSVLIPGGRPAGTHYVWVLLDFGRTAGQGDLTNDRAKTPFVVTAPTPSASPSISSVSPNPVTGSASPQPFTINGSNFESGANVILRDKTTGETFPNRPSSSFSSTKIILNPIFTTAAHAWSVEVVNPDGKSSGQFPFQVVSPSTPTPSPSISNVSPNPVTGSASPQPFTINGANFVTGANVILRDKTTGETFPNRPSSSFSSTKIILNPIFTTAAHAWSVEVVNPDGKSSGQFPFQVVSPSTPAPSPSISSVSPNPVTGSASAQPFTINGANFVTGANVTLRDISTGEVFPNRASSSFSSTRIVINPIFTTAAHSWSVEVINPDGKSSGQFSFQVVSPSTPAPSPSISSVSPNPVTGSNSSQPFTINGSNFVSGANVTLRDKTTGEVFPNRASSSFSSTRIVINPIFTTAAHSWSVEVINPDGKSSGQFSFQVVSPSTPAPSPSISSVSPNPVTGSNSSQSFTINGSNFVSGANVTLRDKTTGEVFPNRASSSFSSTRIVINPIFTTAAHSWSVEVINPDGKSSGQFSFQVVAPSAPSPSISSVSPNPVTGSNSPQPFTINGSNFVSGANVILRDKSTGEVFPNRSSSSFSSTRIVLNPIFTTAAHTWSVEVVNPDGKSTGQFQFQVR